MNLKLRANATTTPRTRAYIQASTASESELGIQRRTVTRWKTRDTVADRFASPPR